MVGQGHRLAAGHHRGVGHQVAEPQAAMAQVLEKVRTTTSPRRPGPAQLQGRGHGRTGRRPRPPPPARAPRPAMPATTSGRSAPPGRVVGRADEGDLGPRRRPAGARPRRGRCGSPVRARRPPPPCRSAGRCGSAGRRWARRAAARRPGPPKASSRHCRTSLEPLAQKTSSAPTPCSSASAARSSAASAVGVAVEVDRARSRPPGVLAPVSGGGKGDSLVLRRTSASTCGEW